MKFTAKLFVGRTVIAILIVVALIALAVFAPVGPHGPASGAPLAAWGRGGLPQIPLLILRRVRDRGVLKWASQRRMTCHVPCVTLLRDRPKVTGPPRADQNEPLINTGNHVNQSDPVVQRSFLSSPSALTAGTSFDGMNSTNSFCNCAPPDTNGQVGQTQYVQTVNSAFRCSTRLLISVCM